MSAPVTHARGHYEAPLPADATSGRLVFERGVANAVVTVDPNLCGLFVARFEGAVPRVEVAGGTVSIRPTVARRFRGHITLSGRVAWALDVRGGAARVRAALADAEVTAITVRGGASHLDLDLPTPRRRVLVRIGGGVTHVEVRRPSGIPARLHVNGGAHRLAVDDQRFSAVGGPIELGSRAAEGGAGYEVVVDGGAHALVVSTR